MLDRLNSLWISAQTRLATQDFRREEGQALTEYAVVMGIVVVAIVGVITALSTGVHSKLTAVCNAVLNQTSGCP